MEVQKSKILVASWGDCYTVCVFNSHHGDGFVFKYTQRQGLHTCSNPKPQLCCVTSGKLPDLSWLRCFLLENRGNSLISCWHGDEGAGQWPA